MFPPGYPIQRKVSVSSRTINNEPSPMYGEAGLFPIRQLSLPTREDPWTLSEAGLQSLGVHQVDICSCSPSNACFCRVPFPSPVSRSRSPTKAFPGSMSVRKKLSSGNDIQGCIIQNLFTISYLHGVLFLKTIFKNIAKRVARHVNGPVKNRPEVGKRK